MAHLAAIAERATMATQHDRSAAARLLHAAERFTASRERDRRTATREEAASLRRLAPRGDVESTAVRDEVNDARDRSADDRDRAADDRDAIAADRDEAAAQRDATADARDLDADARDLDADARDAGAEGRDSIADIRVAAGRDSAAADRTDAGRERARLESELRSAHLDELTGADRRETGLVLLAQEVDRARRGDGRFVVAFVDVDGLKQINDERGHAAGDHVLRTLGGLLRDNLRSFDRVVRYGGDEFVAGLGAMDPPAVRRRFKAIDEALRAATGTGVSIGLATLEADETVASLVARSDAAMLERKRQRTP